MSASIATIRDLDLSPVAGKRYWQNVGREWREEFIYFLMVDRFHDDRARFPAGGTDRIAGFGQGDRLKAACGGTIKGITAHLDYIRDLGCTAIWLSPVFENNPESYHGYAIQDYLKVDSRFGTMDDLRELVDKAHRMDMRVILDIVLHHSGNNWHYPGNIPYYYYNGAVFPFGGWRFDDKPAPIEFRNPDLYGKKGQIRNFDTYPETREGDFQSLKAFRNDNSPEALYVQELLTRIHCYWIKETDVDGFRLDAVKHMGERTISNFCSQVREYAHMLGKKNFFLFGELVGPEELYGNYTGPKTAVMVDDSAVYYGLDSVLDFPLYHVLSNVILGNETPEKLINRYESLRKNALSRGEFGEFLVTFIDNHDQVGQEIKQRFGHQASEKQIIAGIGFLLCALGTPCIYYGTEQGFNGHGPDDSAVREAMFSLDDYTTNALNRQGKIYREISTLASIRNQYTTLRFGRMYMRAGSRDGKSFGMQLQRGSMVAFSRILSDQEMVIAYNTSLSDAMEEYIEVDHHLNKEGDVFHYCYGGKGKLHVLRDESGTRHFVRLKIEPTGFVILSNGKADKYQS